MEYNSNVNFTSNLQVLNRRAGEDREFLEKVHDPFVLNNIKAGKYPIMYSLTGLQNKEAAYGLHCSRAAQGNYPWGTVIDNGSQKVVCRCMELNCPRLSQCRGPITQEEKTVYLDDVKLTHEADLVLKKYNEVSGNGVEFANTGDRKSSLSLKRKFEEAMRKRNISDKTISQICRKIEECSEIARRAYITKSSIFEVREPDDADKIVAALKKNEDFKRSNRLNCNTYLLALNNYIQFLQYFKEKAGTSTKPEKGVESATELLKEENICESEANAADETKKAEKNPEKCKYRAEFTNPNEETLSQNSVEEQRFSEGGNDSTEHSIQDAGLRKYIEENAVYLTGRIDAKGFEEVYKALKAEGQISKEYSELTLEEADALYQNVRTDIKLRKKYSTGFRSFITYLIFLKLKLGEEKKIIQEENASVDFRIENKDEPAKQVYENVKSELQALEGKEFTPIEEEKERTLELSNVLTEEIQTQSQANNVVPEARHADVSVDIEEEQNQESVTEDDQIPDFTSFRSTEQQLIIKADTGRRIVVNAGPGTGKTWTIIEKIKYMTSDLEMDPSQILVLCFSRSAVEVIKDRMEEAEKAGKIGSEWNRIDIRTFDSFATYLISAILEDPEACENGFLPAGYTLTGQDYDARIRTATNIIREHPDLLEYQHMIVDEVQDLVGYRAELVLALLETAEDFCGFTVLGDYCQALYDYMSGDTDDGHLMSSREFYEEIFRNFRKADYYTLTTNHRQNEKFDERMSAYRRAILTGSIEDCERDAGELFKQISKIDEKALCISDLTLRPLLERGTVGILTRNNGEALAISEALQNQGIPHKYQQSVKNEGLGDWIAQVFTNYENSTINEHTFSECFSNIYPAVNPEPYWRALLKTLPVISSNSIDVEDLLSGLVNNARDPLLFESVHKDFGGITVSNVHRSKGKEFDSVILLDDLLPGKNKNNDSDQERQEHKVCYVALTRPRLGTCLATISETYRYIKTNKNDGRCFRTPFSKKGKPYLSNIEVRGVTDFDQREFAISEEIQKYITTEIRPGHTLKLQKAAGDGFNSSHPYVLMIDDNEMILGYSCESFKWGIYGALRRIYPNGSIDRKWYPTKLVNISVNRKITCISPRTDELKGAKSFGNYYIWTGLDANGFAKNDLSRMG